MKMRPKHLKVWAHEYKLMIQCQKDEREEFMREMMMDLDHERRKAGIGKLYLWAKLSGIGNGTLSHFLHGRRTPSPKQVESMCEAIITYRDKKQSNQGNHHPQPASGEVSAPARGVRSA